MSTKIYCVPAQLPTDLEALALVLVTPGRRAREAQMKRPQDRLHCLLAGLLLRGVLGVTRDEQLRTGPWGKPFLTDGGAQFNLAHSGDWVALAVGDRALGVDVEHPRTISPALIRRQFSPAEQAWAGKDPEKLLELWTARESVMKATGRGITLASDALEVRLGPQGPNEARAEGALWVLHRGLLNDHPWCLADLDPDAPDLRRLTLTDLLKGSPGALG